jgi:arylsulfatase/uncharacterized sulfatase
LNTFKFYAGEGGIRSPAIISGATVATRNRIHDGLTHVTDIVPTLLDLAQVAHPGTTYQGRNIEAIAGRSLVPVLADPATRLRTADQTLGYELAGNKALFKGNLKLVLNIPPVGDGRWHLYDLSTDPGETRDLQKVLPQQFVAMQADYAAWAQAHGVLPMPEGYNPVKQVLINTFVNYWIPTYRNTALAVLAGLVGVIASIVWMRRHRRRA